MRYGCHHVCHLRLTAWGLTAIIGAVTRIIAWM